MPVYKLNNSVMPYEWGTTDFIADLLGVQGRTEPMAELWMGVHSIAPSTIQTVDGVEKLSEFIRNNPDSLGSCSLTELPFLLKVLSARKALSIQVHPNKQQAEQGFNREEKSGIDIASRSYKDSNHKPEIACALTDFTMLSGFRETSKIYNNLNRLCPTTLSALLLEFKSDKDIRRLYERLLKTETKDEVLSEALSMCKTGNDDISYWISELNKQYPNDITVLAPTYLNLIGLKPGEAYFSPAGVLHSYLRGTIMELMTNSDNVVRGGLTSKTVDIEELMSITDFKPSVVQIIRPVETSVTKKVYMTDSEEFQLAVISLADGREHNEIAQVQILFCLEGYAKIQPDMEFRKGESVFVTAGTSLQITGNSVLYQASVPSPTLP